MYNYINIKGEANKKETSILFILPVLGQPRHAKRIKMLEKVGFFAEAAAFERKYHRGRMPDCPIKKLGKVSHGSYISRLLRFFLVIPSLRKLIRRAEVIYAFGPDMAFLAYFAAFGLRRCLVLEVGDIREAQVASGFSGRLFRLIDKWITERCSFLVVTAEGFLDEYYRKILKSNVDAIVIENKLDFPLPVSRSVDEAEKTIDITQTKDKPIRIGYFGLLRCEWSWSVLYALAKARPRDIEIILAGYFIEQPDNFVKLLALPNVKYKGEYRSTIRDLENIYSCVDIIWVAYPYFGPSLNPWVFLLSRSNRFYESCYFRKPMITFEGTGDAAIVKKYDIGLVVKDENMCELIDFIYFKISDNLSIWKRNIKSIPVPFFIYTSEADDLKLQIIKYTVK